MWESHPPPSYVGAVLPDGWLRTTSHLAAVPMVESPLVNDGGLWDDCGIDDSVLAALDIDAVIAEAAENVTNRTATISFPLICT